MGVNDYVTEEERSAIIVAAVAGCPGIDEERLIETVTKVEREVSDAYTTFGILRLIKQGKITICLDDSGELCMTEAHRG